MGDMADYYLSMAGSYWEERNERDEGEYPNDFQTRKECGYCGRRGLQWSKMEYGWRLVDDKGEVHTCKAFRIARAKRDGRQKTIRPRG